MRPHGFFCFSLALVFALATFALSDSGSAIKEKILEAETIALSLEQGSLKRFEIEQNADKAIVRGMEESIRNGMDSSERVKRNTDSALWTLFEKEKNQSSGEIEFYSATASKKEYWRIGFSGKNKPLEKKDLEENSKAIVFNIGGLAFVAEYSITGGLLKNKIIFAKLSKPKSSQSFLIPIDYSNKTMVIK